MSRFFQKVKFFIAWSIIPPGEQPAQESRRAVPAGWLFEAQGNYGQNQNGPTTMHPRVSQSQGRL
jgi:hypothetical protein